MRQVLSLTVIFIFTFFFLSEIVFQNERARAFVSNGSTRPSRAPGPWSPHHLLQRSTSQSPRPIQGSFAFHSSPYAVALHSSSCFSQSVYLFLLLSLLEQKHCQTLDIFFSPLRCCFCFSSWSSSDVVFSSSRFLFRSVFAFFALRWESSSLCLYCYTTTVYQEFVTC